MKRIDAIVLAGGRGTRLSPVVSDRPKVLADVNGRPFLDIILEALKRSSLFDNLILAIGHMAEQIVKVYGDRSKYPDVKFSIEDKLLGTGGAIKKALSLTDKRTLLVLNGDSFIDIDLEGFIEFHTHLHSACTIAITEVDDTKRYGRIVSDEHGRVLGFKEKDGIGGKGRVNAGVYIFERYLFDEVPAGAPMSLEKELFPEFLKKGVYGYVTKGKFIDIGTPESYAVSQSYFT